MSVINEVVEAVMEMIRDAVSGWRVTRDALGTGPGIACEVGPSMPDAVYMDKNTHVPLDVTLNGKGPDLRALSDAMNTIHSALTRTRFYPRAAGWQITDITNYTLPEIIGREENNDWLMASALSVRFYWRGD